MKKPQSPTCARCGYEFPLVPFVQLARLSNEHRTWHLEVDRLKVLRAQR